MIPQPELQAPSQPTLAPPTTVVGNLMYKNDLHCYCQKLGIPLPVYQTAVEGCPQSIRFRSTVSVGTRSFTSSNTFPNRKSAEQDTANLALQHLLNENEARSTNLRNLVCQDKARCKMILYEFAAKIKAEFEYKTVQVEISSVFVSSLTLNSRCYNGEAGKNKKEAEQLAALAAILSLLDDLTYAATISEVIKSKFKSCAAFYEVKNFQNTRNCCVTNDDHKTTNLTNDVQMLLSQQTYSRALADEIVQRSIKLPGNNDEQDGSKKLTDKNRGCEMVDEKQEEMVNLKAKTANGSNNDEQDGSKKLTDKHCGYRMVDEKQQELVNLQTKTANGSNVGVLDDKQDSAGSPIEAVTVLRSSYAPLPIISSTLSESQHEYRMVDEKQEEMVNLQAKTGNGNNFGVLDAKQDSAGFPIEAVTVSRSSYVPLPIISSTLSESQHKYKSSEAAMVPSASQQNNIPKCVTTEDVTDNLISAKTRAWNESKKRRMARKRAATRVKAETQGNNEEQGDSRKLTDKHCGHGIVDEKQQELVNLQAKVANRSNLGVLDDKQDRAGFPVEAVTVSRSSYVPSPIISPAMLESQHEYKLLKAAMVPSVSQQNSILKCVTTQDVTNNLISAKK